MEPYFFPMELPPNRRQSRSIRRGKIIGKDAPAHRARKSRHHGSEYVFVLVKLFIASCTPSLYPSP
ncbi:MAG TPA: hypothetical protein VIK97_14185, partial [Casimicrobiaceae bacterium]